MKRDKKEIWQLLKQRGARFPVVIKGLTCGARNRQGQPCGSKQLYKNGRCRYHGGLSTGPKTMEGKRRAALNLLVGRESPP